MTVLDVQFRVKNRQNSTSHAFEWEIRAVVYIVNCALDFTFVMWKNPVTCHYFDAESACIPRQTAD